MKPSSWMPYSLFLSTPSARRATLDATLAITCRMYFYPRPPRGGRPAYTVAAFPAIFISIHALREEGDVGNGIVVHSSGISIHALREEGDCLSGTGSCYTLISIHALREEGDHGHFSQLLSQCLFLSTPSARRATEAEQCEEVSDCISIHALREEGDHGKSK